MSVLAPSLRCDARLCGVICGAGGTEQRWHDFGEQSSFVDTHRDPNAASHDLFCPGYKLYNTA